MTDFGLSPQQLQVIDALSNGATMTRAAEQAGIHRNTLANWRRNLLPFQHALANAQYDRALLFREKLEDRADLALQTLESLLTDPKTPAAVRLKAALAILQAVTTPPPPKKQVLLEIEKITVTSPTEPLTEEHRVMPDPPTPVVHPATAVHNSAQSPRTVPQKIGRNEACHCGSGKKYKRCCVDKPVEIPLAAAA